jgi:phage tail protein X
LVIDPPLLNVGDRNLGQRIIVQEGDTLEKLARRIYGRVDDEILIFVQDHNPAIADINFIRKGWEIYFPPLVEMPE